MMTKIGLVVALEGNKMQRVKLFAAPTLAHNSNIYKL